MDNWIDAWNKVADRLVDAEGIAWDGCHKIYILMDAEQVARQEEYGYEYIIRSSESTYGEMLVTLKEWFDDSCFLRFINAVRRVESDPNKGYEDVIPQFFGEDEVCPICQEDPTEPGSDCCAQCQLNFSYEDES
jgi:hypothetical protein